MLWEMTKLIRKPPPNFIAVKNKAMMVSKMRVYKSVLTAEPAVRPSFTGFIKYLYAAILKKTNELFFAHNESCPAMTRFWAPVKPLATGKMDGLKMKRQADAPTKHRPVKPPGAGGQLVGQQ